MTNQNNAAQPVLTADELKASSPFQWLARRYTPEVAENMLREHERIVLSKLRAPVAGEARSLAEVWKLNAAELRGHGHNFGAWVLESCAKDLEALDAAPQASEAECSCPSGNGSLRHPCAVHPAGEAVKQPACHVGHANFTPFYLLANLRRICTPSLARRENWVLAIELFAVGGTTARRICREAGIDPDGKTVTRAALSARPGAQKGGSDA